MRKTDGVDGLYSGDITSLSFSLILPGFEPATAPSRVMLGEIRAAEKIKLISSK